MIICGDFNDLRTFSDQICRLAGLTQLVDFPTRGDNSLDLLFTNFSTSRCPTRFSPIGKSDHALVFWSPVCSSQKIVKKKVRNFSKSSVSSFHQYIDSIDWISFISSCNDIDEAFETFLYSLFAVFDFFFPLKTVRVRPCDKPWVRPSLKILIDARDRAYSLGQLLKYRRLRKETIHHIKCLKSRYFTEVSHGGDQRKIWRSIRSFSGESRSTHCSQNFSPEELNDYFSSVFQVDTEQCPDLKCNDSLPESVSVFEVHDLLSSLKRKACGPDGLPFWVFHGSSFSLAPVITFLFNWSLNASYFPVCLKRAIINPIPKIPKPSCVSDYRPISLLPILSKVMEKLVLRRFVLPCVQSLMNPCQFAYVPKHGSGTVCALTLIYDRITRFLDSPGAVRMLCIDFSKAFDKLLHSSILKSAQNFNIAPSILLWIQSFLTDRTQCVRIADTFSSWSSISSGVPQGSVLGPILFCMVVDGFRCMKPNSFCVKYADDFNILHFIRRDCEDNLQEEWNYVCQWSASHCLPVNEAKCSVMNIVTKKSIYCCDVFTSNHVPLPKISNVKILGVLFSSDLKWNVHFDYVIKKLSKRFYLIHNLMRSGCPTDLLLRAFYAYFRSVMLYGYPAFCNASDYLIKKFERVENRFKRLSAVTPDVPFQAAATKMCERLFNSILKHPDHELRSLFRPCARAGRSACVLRPPFARTKRFGDSFVKFARI